MKIPRGEVLDTLTLYREEITPEIAKEMLENHGNKSNRGADKQKNKNAVARYGTSRQRVDAYARDMANNRWDEKAVNPIVFDNSGVLRDGHNRLMAVIESDTPTLFYVAEEAEFSNTYDIGGRRTANQILWSNGVSSSTLVTSIIRTIGDFCFGVNVVPQGEIEHAYEADFKGLTDVANAACKGTNHPIGKRSQYVAAFYCAYKCGVPIETIKAFARVFNTGIPDNSDQISPIVLRNQALSSTSYRADRLKLFYCTQEALRDFINGTKRRNSYTGKTAVYSTQFVDAFRAGTLYGGKS